MVIDDLFEDPGNVPEKTVRAAVDWLKQQRRDEEAALMQYCWPYVALEGATIVPQFSQMDLLDMGFDTLGRARDWVRIFSQARDHGLVVTRMEDWREVLRIGETHPDQLWKGFHVDDEGDPMCILSGEPE